MTRPSLGPVRFGLRVILLLCLLMVACIRVVKDVGDVLSVPLVKELRVVLKRRQGQVIWRLGSGRDGLRRGVEWVVLKTNG